MFLSFLMLHTLSIPVFAGWSNTEVESITACTTQYGSTENNTNYWTTWVPTDTYTTTTWANLWKTEVVTPKPLTTTLSTTSTSTWYSYVGDNMTTTIYTSTYYDVSTVTQTKTVPSATTTTLTQVETLTVPTLTGFVPIASASPYASKKPNGWEDPADWDVEDVYWSIFPAYSTLEWFGPFDYTMPTPTLLWRRQETQSAQPSKVACTVTVRSHNFVTTATVKQSGPRATFTRTEVVATTIFTSTVRTKPTTTPPSTLQTQELMLWKTNTSYITTTVTAVETATETAFPSSTSVQAACGSANIVDSYNGYMLHRPLDWFPNNANYTKQEIWGWDPNPVNSAEECCARAVVDPKTIFWKWDYGCEIWKGDAASCPTEAGINGTSGGKIGVDVYYEPISDQGYFSSFDVGNGACGDVGFVSLWE
ncbi:hypothetical protein E8E13_006378 [Curvularia kusanoi]|uniref:Uncharacterized protein n=1 Tax=Curvularia kusanoi TaxID=90978 RepID=A0A9P4W9K9_CURKU|nr:hypothetical protein E8E13_006378 [Curvularia kusanoi]